MSIWMIWLAVAGILVAIEIFSGTFYLLMIAIGLAAGGLTAMAGAHFSVQFIVAGVVGLLVTLILRKSRLFGKPHPQRNPAVYLDIGQTLDVGKWEKPDDGSYRARVNYRGALWDVELLPEAEPKAGQFVIREIRGAVLLVDNCHE